MQPETARMILFAVAAAASVVWLIGLWFLVGSFHAGRAAGPRPFEPLDPAGPPAGNVIRDRAEVEGRPAGLAAKAASILAGETMGPWSQLKILERTAERITFEGAGAVSASRAAAPIRRGQLEFRSLTGDRTAISYEVEIAARRWLLWLGGCVQALGLAALLIGFWAIDRYVVTSNDPAVRGQVFQMVQVVHFLWPAFLFGGLYRMGRRAVRAQFDLLIHNLPYRET
jgi:hypothetical protein